MLVGLRAVKYGSGLDVSGMKHDSVLTSYKSIPNTKAVLEKSGPRQKTRLTSCHYNDKVRAVYFGDRQNDSPPANTLQMLQEGQIST